tara:strand:+ start:283 stop:435 length:153 start_codon:yes stop_codon:yes gene_type:complete
MYDNINKTELDKLLDDPNFMVSNVYGPKPSSEEYKLGLGTWNVTGYYKSK